MSNNNVTCSRDEARAIRVELTDAMVGVRKASDMRMGVMQARARFTNLLTNHAPKIIAALAAYEEAGNAAEVASLEQMLADSDAQLAAANKRIRELEASNAGEVRLSGGKKKQSTGD